MILLTYVNLCKISIIKKFDRNSVNLKKPASPSMFPTNIIMITKHFNDRVANFDSKKYGQNSVVGVWPCLLKFCVWNLYIFCLKLSFFIIFYLPLSVSSVCMCVGVGLRIFFHTMWTVHIFSKNINNLCPMSPFTNIDKSFGNMVWLY